MTRTCESCEGEFTARRSTARFCSSDCRVRAWRAQGATAVADPDANSAALEELLEGLDGADPALVQAARSLAQLVDANPTQSALWARYLSVLDRLRDEMAKHDTLELAELLAQLQAPNEPGGW